MSEPKEVKKNTLSKQAFGLVIGLCVEFILGISTTFYVSFPEQLSEKQNWEFAQNQMLLVLHMIIGVLLLLGALSLLVQALRKKVKQWVILASFGFVFLLGAVFSGSRFVSSQSDTYSYTMALGFIGALFVYIWGLYKVKS